MDDLKLKKIKNYLNNLFKTEQFIVKKRKNIDDSCEIYVNDEFLGLIYEEVKQRPNFVIKTTLGFDDKDLKDLNE